MTSPYGHPFSQTLPDLTASLERKPRRTAVHAATTGNIDLTAASVTQDGATLSAGKRLLAWQQTDPLEDGIYAYGTVSGGVAQLYRVWPMSDQTEFVDRIFPGDMVYVEAGTLHGKSIFLNTWTGDPVVGTDAPVWRKLITPAGETLTASDIPIVDAGGFYASTNVETALQEVRSDLAATTAGNGASLVSIQDAATRFTGTEVETALTEVPTLVELASTANALGASLVGIEDAGTDFTATTVEGALVELAAVTLANGITNIQLTSGTLNNGASVINTGITVTAASRAIVTASAVVTGSVNVGTFAHLIASNVVGGPGVGAITINLLGDDGAVDADAGGTFHALLIN